jgi:hypothetical protein
MDRSGERLSRAIELSRGLPPDHELRSGASLDLAVLFARNGRPEQAEDMLLELHAFLAGKLGGAHARTRAVAQRRGGRAVSAEEENDPPCS